MTDPILLNQRYQLQERLGSGGMAMVFRARDLTLERDVALKILREKYSIDPAFRDHFRQEAKAAANLYHPNIVTVHDFGYDSDHLFIVMELVPGIDLKTILQKQGNYSIKDSLKLMIQACAGVGYAHRAGLVHCDIKSQNFIITPDNRLKITDFGIARALATIQPDEKLNVVWGSPQYFSPEQASGKPPSPASDVYSLGVVMFEIITGKLPFNGNTSEELARMHRNDPPPSPSRINPKIPPALEQIILKILSKEPTSRFRTADQLGRVLVNYAKEYERQNENHKTLHTQNQNGAAPIQIHSDINSNKSYRATSSHLQQAPLSYRRISKQTNKQLDIESNTLNIDWITILLALIALITVGGLIPFWMWIYFLYQ